MNDAQDFEAFVQAHEDLVFGVALRLVGNAAEAEDVAQTVFLRAFERFDTLRAHPAVVGWLRTVTTNLCLNHLSRYRARWRFFSELGRDDDDDDHATDQVEALLAHHTDSGRERQQRYGAEDVERALRRLPPRQRVPLVLYHFENFSYQEIAARLGVSLGKVKTDIHRARQAMKHHLVSDHD